MTAYNVYLPLMLGAKWINYNSTEHGHNNGLRNPHAITSTGMSKWPWIPFQWKKVCDYTVLKIVNRLTRQQYNRVSCHIIIHFSFRFYVQLCACQCLIKNYLLTLQAAHVFCTAMELKMWREFVTKLFSTIDACCIVCAYFFLLLFYNFTILLPYL